MCHQHQKFDNNSSKLKRKRPAQQKIVKILFHLQPAQGENGFRDFFQPIKLNTTEEVETPNGNCQIFGLVLV